MARLRHWLSLRNALFLTLGLLVASALFLLGASKIEEQNAFCTSCHTVPEQTYLNRAQTAQTFPGAQIVDLASSHFGDQKDFRCIDCHRGDQGLTDRASTLTLGAEDALIFLSGQADPTREKTTAVEPDLLNRACVECHTKEILARGFNNHFHNRLAISYVLQTQNGASGLNSRRFGTAVTCTDCHKAHVHLDNGISRKFLDVEGVVYPACVDCHKQLGQGPLDLAP